MGSEVYQAQVVKAFIDVIVSPDRNLTRLYFCVITLAKLRNESPEKFKFLVEQLQKSKAQKILSMDILDYVAEVANSLDDSKSSAVFGIPDNMSASDFGSISLDSL